MLLILHLSSVWLTCHIYGCYVRLSQWKIVGLERPIADLELMYFKDSLKKRVSNLLTKRKAGETCQCEEQSENISVPRALCCLLGWDGALVRDSDCCSLGKEEGGTWNSLFAHLLFSCHFCHTETVGPEPGGCSAVEGTCVLEGLVDSRGCPAPAAGFWAPANDVHPCPV